MAPTLAPFTLRMARDADLARLAVILAQGVAELKGAPGQPFAEATAGEELLVAARLADDAPLGFAAMWRPHRFIHHLYVAAHARGARIGAALLEGAVALMGGEAELKCLVDNGRALAFYAREGWRPTGEEGRDDGGGAWIRLRALKGANGRLRLRPTPLANAFVRLEPLGERHREPLRAAAADPALWRWWPRDVADWDAAFDWRMAEHAEGRAQTYAVLTPQGCAIGQTSHLSLSPDHARVEIGGTWYAAQAQGTTINPAAKYLMLAHAFASGAQRVELKTDARNARSRAAIERLGAAFEGVHRRHVRLPDGSWRDTAWYSVLAPDWADVRAGLERRLGLGE